MKNYIHSIIIAITVIITACVLSNGLKNRNKLNNSIAVTGLGSKDFVSDLIVWSGSFDQKNFNLKEAYAALDDDRNKIKKYLVSKGIKAEEMVFSSVNIEKQYDYIYDNNGAVSNQIFSGYRLRQEIQVESNEVDKVENVSRQVSELINFGIEFYSQNPQYYYTKLAALKLEMISEATKDASERAIKIADNAGGSVGRLKKADMGVFQIVAKNSSEEFSWGGSFNTSSKRKTATITVKLQYEVD